MPFLVVKMQTLNEMGGPTGLEGGHISKSYYYLILGGLVYEKTYFCGKKSNNFIIPFYFTIK